MDVMDQYKNITNKLKKKFLKKPNLAEGSEQFENLARQQKADDSPHYAGVCFLAQARCEQSLGNWREESAALTEAARSFIKAHEFFHHTHCVSFNEDLHSAINCYGHAIRVNNENSQYMSAAQLCIELGKHLKRFGKKVESMQHFQRAIDLLKHNPNERLDVMGLLASAKLESSDFDDALDIYTDMFNLAKSTATYMAPDELVATSKEVLCRCEINMLLLLLFLEPTPQSTSPQHARLLEKYTWDVDEEYLESFCPWVVCEIGLQRLSITPSQTTEVGEKPRGNNHVSRSESLKGSRSGAGSGSVTRSIVGGGSVVGGGVKGYMSLELFFALQSLAMAWQADGGDELISSESHLQTFLNLSQQHVLHLVLVRQRNKMKDMLELAAS